MKRLSTWFACCPIMIKFDYFLFNQNLSTKKDGPDRAFAKAVQLVNLGLDIAERLLHLQTLRNCKIFTP